MKAAEQFVKEKNYSKNTQVQHSHSLQLLWLLDNISSRIMFLLHNCMEEYICYQMHFVATKPIITFV